MKITSIRLADLAIPVYITDYAEPPRVIICNRSHGYIRSYDMTGNKEEDEDQFINAIKGWDRYILISVEFGQADKNRKSPDGKKIPSICLNIGEAF